ncbi:MAG: PH domain-containing protein [Thermosediminibacteraceae bacterium]|nr:PH domain-containing protein [Thermosediminibacteraceae bacterium]
MLRIKSIAKFLENLSADATKPRVQEFQDKSFRSFALWTGRNIVGVNQDIRIDELKFYIIFEIQSYVINYYSWETLKRRGIVMADALSTKYTFFTEIPIPEHLRKMLTEHEKPIFAVKTIRDAAVFTDKRILIADKQGLTGKKVEYCTIPYKVSKISDSSLESMISSIVLKAAIFPSFMAQIRL